MHCPRFSQATMISNTLVQLFSIVALHGLNGHREKTFTANNGVCWLNSLLPDRMPKIRVISFGYDARTHSSSPLSQQHLHSHAEQLVENLTRRRDVSNVRQISYPIVTGIILIVIHLQTMTRPIIFVAHSLGGIVVKSVSKYYTFSCARALLIDIRP